MELSDLTKSKKKDSVESYKTIDIENIAEDRSEDQQNGNSKGNAKNGSDLLQPGSDIQPQVSKDDVERLVERLYGIVVTEMKELNSYDDRNYLIQQDRNVKNPLITHKWPHGYVLKILNAHDSKKIDFVSAQNELLLFLKNNQGINCPRPIQNVYGKYFSKEVLNGAEHVVRLLEFIPGKILHDAVKNENLYYQTGEYVAKLDRSLKNFSHDAYKNHTTLWMLNSLPKLRDFIYVLEDQGRREIVEQVIEAFESNVLTKIDSFEKQMIHGDFNEHNILVERPKGQSDYRVVGVIDFGDTSHSPIIFELAITMMYMIIEAKDLAVGGLVLAGYTSIKNVKPEELKVLKECVAARFCQSLVMGAYTHSLHPTNDYLLTTQNTGWTLLESLWKENLDTVDELWQSTADEYLKQSSK